MVLSMDRWIGKVAVVTGASAGIGLAIAQRLVQEGLQVVGLARRLDRLQLLSQSLEGAKGKFYPLKADISQETDILSAFEWIKSNVGPVHILINNAGVIKPTDLIDGNTEMWKQVFDTNVVGLCICTREAIKSMTENNIDGHIIHINSVAGHYVMDIPKSNVYPASKYAVTALTETLRQEINRQKLKIKITSLSPGGTATEIVQANNFDTDNVITELMAKVKLLEPEDIADSVVYVLSTPPHVQIQELTIRQLEEPSMD